MPSTENANLKRMIEPALTRVLDAGHSGAFKLPGFQIYLRRLPTIEGESHGSLSCYRTDQASLR